MFHFCPILERCSEPLSGDAVSKWADWVLAHLEVGSLVNPIPTGAPEYAHTLLLAPPPSLIENLTASLLSINFSQLYQAIDGQ